MSRLRLAAALPALAACFLSLPARGAGFDDRGVFSFAAKAALAESFEDGAPPDPGTASTAQVVESSTALDGGHVLRITLRDDAWPLPLLVPAIAATYRVTYWLRGDCVSGVAADYDDSTPPAFAHAYPTGRVTSDGWMELQAGPILLDGTAQGRDLRLFFRGFDASTTTSVDIDAVEVVQEGMPTPGASCSGLDVEGACTSDEVCVEGRCRDARGWFPPLPPDADREAFVRTWVQRIHDTFGPYRPRHVSMPAALVTLDSARSAPSAVRFWSTFAEAVRRLGDAHTYFRAAFQKSLPARRPLNACFFEGDGDLTHDVWPSDPAYHDILVSHVGPGRTWGLRQGDRLVAIDGAHPLAWARTLISKSYSYWESDDPSERASVATQLRTLIPLHARSITVLHCDAASVSCSPAPEVIDVQGIAPLEPGETASLVGCDNRPFYHIAGAPEDHLLGLGITDEPEALEGQLLESSPEENLRGLVWNTLFGGWPSSPLDAKLRSAVATWQSAGGVVEDHREGHGGTTDTAEILVGFSRTPFVALASMFRARADDEGPASPAEGEQIFEQIKGYAALQAGSAGARTDIPVALLLTWDVSASDFLPYMMKGAPNVRLLGPGPTMGAFGTFFQYSYWGGLLWSVSAEDSLSPDGLTLTGRGVVPDEVILPRQSDLLRGKDTLHDAAVAWLRSEVTP